MKAANDMLAALPAKPEYQETQQQRALSYEQLKEFHKYRKQLDDFYHQLFQIIQDCTNRVCMAHTLIKEIKEASQKLQSKRFRLAVVGEFSKGKSTLLNALLNEEIQPVREIPCNGTVTVLKYGAQKRVVCRFKDGQEEEIPFYQYQEKAVISEEAALGSFSDELAHSEIDEIIYEHPALDLCSSGVEIVDSPGLNEHPDRTAVIQKLLKDTDAAIFLTSASQVLTQGERDLLQDLQTHLNGGKADVPAENLFLVVNFWDMLRTETGRKQVQKRVLNIVQGQNPMITGENRVHFISAQKALEAILNGTEDEYLKTFQSFTQSIEKFLTLERGSLEIKQSLTKVNGLIQAGLDGLHRTEELFNSKVKKAETDKQKIFEQIGEASGRYVKLSRLADQLKKQAIEQAGQSWDEWAEGLDDRIAKKSENWSSEHSHLWSQDKLIRHYTDHFVRDLSREVDDWVNKILEPGIQRLDKEIINGIEAIRKSFQVFEHQLKTSLVNQFNFAAVGAIGEIGTYGPGIASSIDPNISGVRGFLGGLGAGGLVAAVLSLFTGVGITPVILSGLAAAAGGSVGLGLLDVDGIHIQIKKEVCKLGLEMFNKSVDKYIASVFCNRVKTASGIIKQAISISENLLEQQEKAHKETLKQREAEKAWIAQKRQELKQVQNNIEAILNQSAG